MPDNKPDSEERVKEWLARRLGENLPPRPRPARPRPPRHTDPPMTTPARSGTPLAAPRRLPATLVPHGETPRPAPVSVGPSPHRVAVNDAGSVLAEADGRGTEAEDTGELLFEDTSPSKDSRPVPAGFRPDPREADEAPTKDIAPLRAMTPREHAARGAWDAEIEPFPAAPGRSPVPPAPDAFTAGYPASDPFPEPGGPLDPFPQPFLPDPELDG
ncbi:MAG: hypothetical protein AAGA48_29680, partial [Myxococcota bacterium]